MRHWIAVAAILATADARAQTNVTAAQVAAQVHNTYAALKTFEAGLTESVSIKGGASKTKKVRTGRLRVARGGKLRFDATNGDVVFTDGTVVYSYEAAANTAWMMSPRRSPMVAALAFLQHDLAQDFKLRLSTSAQPNPTTAHLLIANPNVTWPTVRFAGFFVTPSMEVGRVFVFDAKLDHTTFELASPTLNPALGPATFQWKPPAGAKVITI